MEQNQSPIQPYDSSAPAAAASEPIAEDGGPAGFWVRAGSLVIDSLVLWIVQLSMLLSGIPGASVFGFLAHFAYHTVTIAAWGQSFGKMAAGTRVVRLDGSRPGLAHAALRAGGMLLSGALVGLGYFVAAFTPQKRALHDYVAGTRVVFGAGVGGGRKAAMVVVALLGISLPVAIGALVAVGIAKVPGLGKAVIGARGDARFDEIRLKASEGVTKGGLGSLRAGASIYFGDKEGVYPEDLSVLTAAGPGGQPYVERIPEAETTEHGKTSEVERYGAEACAGDQLKPEALRDTGRWGYVADPKSPCWGQVFVDCTHADTKGKPWHSY